MEQTGNCRICGFIIAIPPATWGERESLAGRGDEELRARLEFELETG